MDELTAILRNATRAIPSLCYRLPIADGIPIYRERVYCYELYHQMRKRWPRDCIFCLNGEVNKRAHPVLRELEADKFQPDLLVHGPGDMALNHAIIEVKSVLGPLTGIRKDLSVLSLFRNAVGYERAVYLFYGDGLNGETLRRVERNAAQVNGLAQIEVWFHSRAGSRAEQVGILGP